MKTSPRTKRAKAEIQQEFSAIQDEIEGDRDYADAKAEKLARHKQREVRQAVEGVSVDGVVEQISRLGLEISRALSGISEKLVDEVNRLATLRSAVSLESQELERLHKIDIAATALDQLVQDYAKRREQLESEIGAQRSVWEDNVQTAERERKEHEEALKKQRQRGSTITSTKRTSRTSTRSRWSRPSTEVRNRRTWSLVIIFPRVAERSRGKTYG